VGEERRFKHATIEKWVKDFAIGKISVDRDGVGPHVPAAK